LLSSLIQTNGVVPLFFMPFNDSDINIMLFRKSSMDYRIFRTNLPVPSNMDDCNILNDHLINSNFKAYFGLDTNLTPSGRCQTTNHFLALRARLNEIKHSYLDNLQIYSRLPRNTRWDLSRGRVVERFILRAIFTNVRPVPDHMLVWRELWLGEIHLCSGLANTIDMKLRHGKRDMLGDLMGEFEANLTIAERQLNNVQLMVDLLASISSRSRFSGLTSAERGEIKEHWLMLEDLLNEKDDLQWAAARLTRDIRHMHR
jgi:hypothetical protein